MKFKDFILRLDIATDLRVWYDRKNYSGCFEDDEYRETLKPLYDKEVLMFTTAKGMSFLDENVGEPYIEIELGD